MNDNNKINVKKKSFYAFIGCIILTILVIGATYAYFSASASDENTVTGNTAVTTFGLNVDKITSVDMGFGLIPMYDDRAPFAAQALCRDDLGNPVCQIYKITINADSDAVMFLDGFIEFYVKRNVEVSFTRVYEDPESIDGETEEDSNLRFKVEENYDPKTMVHTGVRNSGPDEVLTREKDANCLFVKDEKLGGDAEEDMTKIYFVMIWLHDTGTEQNSIQGLEQAYTGKVTFITTDGNEISATFD